MLNALSFGSDPFNICEYIMRRLNNSDFQAIVKMTLAKFSTHKYVSWKSIFYAQKHAKNQQELLTGKR